MRKNPRRRRIAVISNKGGVGKTTQARELGCALARRNYLVDYIDLAPQGNLTRRLGVDREDLIANRRPGLADLLDPSPRNTLTYADILQPCSWDVPWAANVRIAPSLDAFAMQDRASEAARPGADQRLRLALDGYDDDRHIVIIDADPGMDHLCTMAIAAADAVVVCVEPDYDAVEGGVNIVTYVHHLMKALDRPDLSVVGVVVTRVRRRSGPREAVDDRMLMSATARDQVANLPNAFASIGGEKVVWEPMVPLFDTIAAAQSDALPLDLFSHQSARRAEDIFSTHSALLVEALGS